MTLMDLMDACKTGHLEGTCSGRILCGVDLPKAVGFSRSRMIHGKIIPRRTPLQVALEFGGGGSVPSCLSPLPWGGRGGSFVPRARVGIWWGGGVLLLGSHGGGAGGSKVVPPRGSFQGETHVAQGATGHAPETADRLSCWLCMQTAKAWPP